MIIKTTLKQNFPTLSGLSVILFLKPYLLNKTMLRKPLITLTVAILLILLIILANTAESPSDGISGGSEGTAAGLEKDLPAEEKIPTH